MNKLSIEEVKHIAKLANLKLNDDQLAVFSSQLSEVLDYIEVLNLENTDQVEPLSNVTKKTNIFRKDEVKPSLSQEECLKNAPDTYKGYFKVKAIFNNE